MSDPQLVEQCRAGDRSAFEELIRRYEDAVFNLAWRMTGNWHEAADITQETFVRAYLKLHLYRAEYAFKNWILSICANKAKNWFRSQSQRQRVRDELLEMQDEAPVSATGMNDEKLEAALALLPESLRVALVLKHMDGMSYDEISQTLRIGVGAAKMRVARARERLVDLMRGDQENPE